MHKTSHIRLVYRVWCTKSQPWCPNGPNFKDPGTPNRLSAMMTPHLRGSTKPKSQRPRPKPKPETLKPSPLENPSPLHNLGGLRRPGGVVPRASKQHAAGAASPTKQRTGWESPGGVVPRAKQRACSWGAKPGQAWPNKAHVADATRKEHVAGVTTKSNCLWMEVVRGGVVPWPKQSAC